MSEHTCFEAALPLLSPFRKVLSLGWYDGTTSGLAQCSQCSEVFKYDIVDWDSDQERRIFAFSPIAMREFQHIVGLLTGREAPRWPFWSPRWELMSAEKTNIDKLLALARSPEYLVAGDRQLETVFAARRLDGPVRDRLPAVFGGLPVSDDFEYWKEYVGLRG